MALVGQVGRVRAARAAALALFVRRVVHLHFPSRAVGGGTIIVERPEHPAARHPLIVGQLSLPLRRLALAPVLLPVVANGHIDVEQAVSGHRATDDVLLGEASCCFSVLNRQAVRRERDQDLADPLELLLGRPYITLDAGGTLIHHVGPLLFHSTLQLLLEGPGRRDRISTHSQVHRAWQHAVLVHPSLTRAHLVSQVVEHCLNACGR